MTIEAAAADPVAADSPLQFVVRAAPAPRADLVVGVTITAPGCTLTNAPTSVTIAAGKTETRLRVSADAAGAGSNGCTVTAAIDAGEGYRKGDAASARATLPPIEQEPPPPQVTIEANASTVTEGSEVSFTLTATPAPQADLTVTVNWWQEGEFLPASRQDKVIIPTTGTFELTETIPDDGDDEQDGSVTVSVVAGSGYTVGTKGEATVAVMDRGPAAGGGTISTPPPRSEPPAPQLPEVSIATDAWSVTEGATVPFTLTAEPAPPSDLSVNVLWQVSRNVKSKTKPNSWVVTHYPIPGESPVTIPASSSTVTVFVTAPDDNVKNPGIAALGGQVEEGTGYVPELIPVAVIGMIDND
ncbi:MAG: hypothetical protein OXP69_15755 [Spirochaetaceae bacterium]|nr:hypothetical protein [Spirochaetaceae bacterium]